MRPKRKKIGEILLNAGLITAEQLEHVLLIQKGSGKHTGKLLVDMGLTTEADIAQALSSQLSVPILDLGKIEITAKDIIPKEIALKKVVIPVECTGNRMVLAMANPLDWKTIDEIAFRSGLKVSPAVATASSILETIEKHYTSAEKIWNLIDKMNTSGVQFVKQSPEDEREMNVQSLYKSSEAPPIVRLVTMIVIEAVQSRATDIHIEPHEQYVKVRYRVDGSLRDILKFPKHLQSPVVSRIKILSNLDITKRRTPQDGGTHLRMENKDVDLRISTLPSLYGEKVVIRLLDWSTGLISLTKLGMPDNVLHCVMDIFAQPQGMLLVTGPTSSGKTTTLYACLNQLRSETENVVTIEDPVEYKLKGITQVPVNEASGLTFPSALRAVLRQDPDIIMVGEIRDLETAEIAVKAALTGHMVLSTIHTNDTVSTITRLANMGIPPFLLSSAISGVLAQRLVRKICTECSEVEKHEHLGNGLIDGLQTRYKGKGCPKCNYTGYYGQLGVFEYLPFDQYVRDLVYKGAFEDELRGAAKEAGMADLRHDALNKIEKGLTTVEEVLAKVPFPRGGQRHSPKLSYKAKPAKLVS
ncbi:MAG: ATPase, T2SS/T4P/T4SS family [Nitrospiraceae bacterium]|nr:ATPase, T2SS/T4P/T4SS family [Nitrospiraceae bacterium]